MLAQTDELFEGIRECADEEDTAFSGFSADYIIKKVCQFRNISENVMRMKWRKREIVLARQECMYFLKQETKLSLAVIGEKAGGRDHATALHAIKTITNLVEASRMSNSTYHLEIENISRSLYGLDPLPMPEQKRKTIVEEVSAPEEKPAILQKAFPKSVVLEKPVQADPLINMKHPSWNIFGRKSYQKKTDLFVSNCF